MERLQSMVNWYCVAAVVILTVDGLAMRWVEKGQPDPGEEPGPVAGRSSAETRVLLIPQH